MTLPYTGALLLLAACASPKAISSGAESSRSEAAAVDPAITLERTACFGRCPVYRIAASRSGAVTYQGKAHVRVAGPASGHIPAQKVQALLTELEQAGYFSFADRYTPAAAITCGRYSTDSPTAITSARLGDREKRIEHDYGCEAAPKRLSVLERRIDEVLGSAQWVGP